MVCPFLLSVYGVALLKYDSPKRISKDPNIIDLKIYFENWLQSLLNHNSIKILSKRNWQLEKLFFSDNRICLPYFLALLPFLLLFSAETIYILTTRYYTFEKPKISQNNVSNSKSKSQKNSSLQLLQKQNEKKPQSRGIISYTPSSK